MVPRRRILRALGVSFAVGTAGCNALNDAETDGTAETDDPTATDGPAATDEPAETDGADATGTPAGTPTVTPTATLTPGATATESPTPTATPTATPSQQAGTPAFAAADGETASAFGAAVALDGDVALADRFGSRVDVLESGDGGWERAAALEPDGADQFNTFRPAVALADETALVGATTAEADGAVEVFERGDGAWTERTRLTPDEGETYVEFGAALSVDGERLAVGAVGRPERNPAAEGAVFVFERSGDGWTQQAVHRSGERDTFGRAVALSGDTLVVGAPDYEEDDVAVGAAYVYRRSDGAWTREARLEPGEDAGQAFGWRLALDGDVAVVGSLHPAGSGRASVFERADGEWRERTQVPLSDRGNEMLAVDGDRALVTPPGLDRVTVLERADGAWRPTRALVADDGSVDDLFGTSVALDGSRALVGAPTLADDRAGRAYRFDL